jgi:hypothetical protein
MAVRHWVQSWEAFAAKHEAERARPTEAA